VGKFSKRIDQSQPESYVARRPIMCAAYGCGKAGTITESTRHEHPEDATWFCRDHWANRGQSEAPYTSTHMRQAGEF
jgi:hypothetical protein